MSVFSKLIPWAKKLPSLREIVVALVNDKYSTYPSNGLTPYRLAEIFVEADSGNVMRQMELFEEMEEKDPHLFSQLQTRKNAVTGLDFEIIPFGDESKDKEIAEFVKQQFDGFESFEDVIMDLLDAIGKGISVSEIMWGLDEDRVVVEDIKWRHPKKFFWDHEDKFKVYTKDNPQGIELPENKFIIHKYKAKSGHSSRAGILRIVAWMYLFKNYTVKDWVAFCEIYGMPIRLGKYNASASQQDKEALMDALISIGTDAAGILPDTTQIELKEAMKTSSADVYEKLARYCDEQVSKAVLGQTLTSDSSGGGSYAQSKTHNEVRHDLTVADCKAIAATLRRDLIRPLVMFNFGEDRRIPTIRFDVEESEDLKEQADIFNVLINDIGLKVSENHLYKKFSIPKPEQDEQIAEGKKTPMAFEDSLVPRVNSQKTDILAHERERSARYQRQIDSLADEVLEKSNGVFTRMFEPIMKLLDESENLEDVKESFNSETFLRNVFENMDASEFEELLEKAMIIADLTGRMKEHERGL